MVEASSGRKSNFQIAELRAEHDALEKRLAELDGHLSLTQPEQAERARIKKWKLKLKDQMQALGDDAGPKLDD